MVTCHANDMGWTFGAGISTYRKVGPCQVLVTWLAVDPPLWIWVRQLGWWHSQLGWYYSQLNGKIKAMFQTTNQSAPKIKRALNFECFSYDLQGCRTKIWLQTLAPLSWCDEHGHQHIFKSRSKVNLAMRKFGSLAPCNKPCCASWCSIYGESSPKWPNVFSCNVVKLTVNHPQMINRKRDRYSQSSRFFGVYHIPNKKPQNIPQTNPETNWDSAGHHTFPSNTF